MRTVMPYVIGLVAMLLVLVWLGTWTTSPEVAAVQVQIEALGPESAEIVWQAHTPGPGRLEYGTSDRLGSVIQVPESASEHRVRLESLEPSTRYYFRVAVGETVSKIHTFTTQPIPPSFHVEPYLQMPTPDGVTILWETTEKLPGRVEYGLTEQLGQVAHETGRSRLHQVRLTGLQPATAYYYRVVSGDVVSDIFRFRTAPPPGTKTWKMVVYGDSRSNPAMHRRVVEQIAKHDVDLIVHTGDIVGNGKNYASWRREHFVPLAPVARSVPWISVLGNHEANSEHYFSYVALPGNERYYTFDFANARFICLDSNDWIQKGRDSEQYRWLKEQLGEPYGGDWKFAVFHHPLFSGHKTRPINPLRWDWAPLLTDPVNHVDAVLTGHDHFYCRTYPIGRVSKVPLRGVPFITSGGGGAPLYATQPRDYIAAVQSVHHFVLFTFKEDGVWIHAIDVNGNIFDSDVLLKRPTPPEQLCVYEVEEIRASLRKALQELEPTSVQASGVTKIATVLKVPARFEIPIQGTFHFGQTPGWYFRHSQIPFELDQHAPLQIPLEAVVEERGLANTPLLTIEFAPGRFRNNKIEAFPFKLTGPGEVTARRIPRPKLDGIPDEAGWQTADPLGLIATTPAKEAGLGGQVRIGTDGETLFVAAVLDDPGNKVKVRMPPATQEPSRLILSGEHFRVELHDGTSRWVFALSPENLAYLEVDGKQTHRTWQAQAHGGDGVWTAELAIPLSLLPKRTGLRINAARRAASVNREAELRPSFEIGSNPDLIPDWKPGGKPDRSARLVLPAS
ncbi:MAG: fibronectin type III domain-containing protein [Gemmatales bacterium]|nr:fibronectin type III domain-containing protein [Gemmatales bacterium]MDW8387102.1 fibronectin type III domain-containing protein [Gemmatales bacterium]